LRKAVEDLELEDIGVTKQVVVGEVPMLEKGGDIKNPNLTIDSI
jgi:hypothetical protein